MCWRVVGSVSPRVSTRMYPIVGYLGLEQRRRSLRMNINFEILRTGGSAPGDADSGGRAGRLVRCFQVACCGVIEGVRCRGGGGGIKRMPTGYSSREAMIVLQRAGWERARQGGSRINMVRVAIPGIVTIPANRRERNRRTFGNVPRHAGMSRKQFDSIAGEVL